MKRNQEYSSAPSLISERDFPNLLRPRDVSKEIQPGMHYKATSSVQRLAETLQNNASLVDPQTTLSLALRAPKASGGIDGQEGKQRSPGSHSKTHFQAVIALVHKTSKTLVRRDSATAIHPQVVADDEEDSLGRGEFDGVAKGKSGPDAGFHSRYM